VDGSGVAGSDGSELPGAGASGVGADGSVTVDSELVDSGKVLLGSVVVVESSDLASVLSEELGSGLRSTFRGSGTSLSAISIRMVEATGYFLSGLAARPVGRTAWFSSRYAPWISGTISCTVV
jgi:hypothetical protein